LVPCIGHREGIGAFRDPVAREHGDAFGRGQGVRIEIEAPSELLV
jgi:hypothetical protein